MFNKFLRTLENSAWKTAGFFDEWDDVLEEAPANQPTQPTAQPSVSQPVVKPIAPVNVAPKPQPAAPVAAPASTPVMQPVSVPQKAIETPFVSQRETDRQNAGEIQSWVRKNFDTNEKLPSEWGSGGSNLLQLLGKSVHLISRELKREPQNPSLSQVKKVVPESAVDEYDPNAAVKNEAAPETPEQAAIRKARKDTAGEFYCCLS